MGFLRYFSGKSPETHEQKGDSYFKYQEYGLAKTEYEVALTKFKKKSDNNPEYKCQLEKKLLDAKESLARLHKKNGDNLIAAGIYDEAEELFKLAEALTQDENLIAEIKKKCAEIRCCYAEAQKIEKVADDTDEEEEIQTDDDEHFRAMINALPETEKKAYKCYGDYFKTGYLALHNGDFETAEAHLLQARDECREENGFISLELATAQVNLGKHKEAHALLESFLSEHSCSLKAYGLICEILWEAGAFDKAHMLLNSCSPDISGAVPIIILKGETLFKEQKYQEAATLYSDVLETRGWDGQIARFLAKTYESLGESEQARDLYAKVLGACQGCRPDSFLLQRYADTSFMAGDYSTKILEIYLNLTKQDPVNETHYFQQISKIYSHMGNEKEARRFLSFVKE